MKKLGLFLEGQETVARILVHFAVSRKIAGSTLATIFVLGEEVDSLGLAATKDYFGFSEIICYSFAVCMLISHTFLLN